VTASLPSRLARPLPLLAALSGALAVGAGAFGAHGASGDAARWLATGAHYQLLHAAAALAALAAPALVTPTWARRGAGLFVGGGAVFAGTLYAMALGAPRTLGAVTPLGGLALIAGWLCVAAGARGGARG